MFEMIFTKPLSQIFWGPYPCEKSFKKHYFLHRILLFCTNTLFYILSGCIWSIQHIFQTLRLVFHSSNLGGAISFFSTCCLQFSASRSMESFIIFLESFGILWNLLESFGIFWTPLESFGFFCNLFESFRIFDQLAQTRTRVLNLEKM